MPLNIVISESRHCRKLPHLFLAFGVKADQIDLLHNLSSDFLPGEDEARVRILDAVSFIYGDFIIGVVCDQDLVRLSLTCRALIFIKF